MKLLLFTLLFGTVLTAKAQVVPPHWLDPESLTNAEKPIQAQLDTGKGMTSSAWAMASVRDARLFVIYVELYQNLNSKAQRALYHEQEAWLAERKKLVAGKYTPQGGTDASLDASAEHMDLTDKRIKELSERLVKARPAP